LCNRRVQTFFFKFVTSSANSFSCVFKSFSVVILGTIINLPSQLSASAGARVKTDKEHAHLPNTFVHLHIPFQRGDLVDREPQDALLAVFRSSLLARKGECSLRLDGGLLDLNRDLSNSRREQCQSESEVDAVEEPF
jgi:hypothetical protein